MLSEREYSEMLNNLRKEKCSQEVLDAFMIGLQEGFSDGYREAKEDALPPLDESEVAYRRGFAHGWHVGKTNESMEYQEINNWRHSKKLLGAPGTCFANKKFPTNNDFQEFSPV
jgi:hypothetical protein